MVQEKRRIHMKTGTVIGAVIAVIVLLVIAVVIAPLIVACDAAVWLSWADGNFGSILNDIVYALVLGVMSWFVVANLIDDNEALRPFSIATMVYLIMELCLFTSWGIMYAVFDLAVTLSMIVMAVTFVKGISAKEVLV